MGVSCAGPTDGLSLVLFLFRVVCFGGKEWLRNLFNNLDICISDA